MFLNRDSFTIRTQTRLDLSRVDPLALFLYHFIAKIWSDDTVVENVWQDFDLFFIIASLHGDDIFEGEKGMFTELFEWDLFENAFR